MKFAGNAAKYTFLLSQMMYFFTWWMHSCMCTCELNKTSCLCIWKLTHLSTFHILCTNVVHDSSHRLSSRYIPSLYEQMCTRYASFYDLSVTDLRKCRCCIQLNKGTRPTYKAICISNKLCDFNMSSYKTIVPAWEHKITVRLFKLAMRHVFVTEMHLLQIWLSNKLPATIPCGVCKQYFEGIWRHMIQ